jgi:hypothetical protein
VSRFENEAVLDRMQDRLAKHPDEVLAQPQHRRRLRREARFIAPALVGQVSPLISGMQRYSPLCALTRLSRLSLIVPRMDCSRDGR